MSFRTKILRPRDENKKILSVSKTMAQFTEKNTKDRKFENSKVPYHITDISFQTPATGL